MAAVMLVGPDEVAARSPEWLAARRLGVSASDIAAVLGLSPWQSPFSLYWSKVNGWEADENPDMYTGRMVEPAVASWFAHEHAELMVRPGGFYASSVRPWQLVTPDRLLYVPCIGCDGTGRDKFVGMPICPDCDGCGVKHGTEPVAVLECKWVAYSWDGWGEPGTDDVPIYYRTQVLQAIDVMGVDEGHLAALGPDGFRSYLIHRDEKDLRVMREAGRRFHERLLAGEPPPLDDAHTATLRTLKRLHPSIDPDVDDAQVDVDLAEGYRRARAARARAESLVDRYEIRLREAIGDGRRAMCNNRLVASRSVYDVKPHWRDGHTVDRLNPGRAVSYAVRQPS